MTLMWLIFDYQCQHWSFFMEQQCQQTEMGECILQNAEFRQHVFCGNFYAECSANYTLSEFRIISYTVLIKYQYTLF